MASRDEITRNYLRTRKQVADQFDKDLDERHRQSQEKYADDQSTFGKVAKTTNTVVYGVGKVLGFLIRNR